MAEPEFKLCGIVGAGGFGREVAALVDHSLCVERYMNNAHGLRIVFVESAPQSVRVNGMDVMSLEDFIAFPDRRYFSVALADSRKRQTIAASLMSHAEPLPLVGLYHRNLGHNTIGEGSIFCDYTTVTSNVRIGKFFQANIYSYVGHDCVIGDYVTFAPAVKCNGNVHIEDHVYIGTGACIKQGTADAPLTIGEGSVIGMGAVVTRSVPPYTTVVGNPARALVQN